MSLNKQGINEDNNNNKNSLMFFFNLFVFVYCRLKENLSRILHNKRKKQNKIF
jgi:hypothetical protein